MCRLRNIAMRDYQESVTTVQTDRHTQTDAGQSDPYVSLCFAGEIKSKFRHNNETLVRSVVNENSNACRIIDTCSRCDKYLDGMTDRWTISKVIL